VASALGRRSLRHVAANGNRLHFGSDTPSGSIYTNPPGYNGYLELLAMEAAGLSPRQILMAATLENARLFRLSDKLGTVEPGRRADLVLLDANPLASMTAFDAINRVIVAGRVIERSSLQAK
jgi:imidazolonepropionase-like amidohydrolase